jgi:hypothetical protein
MRRHLIPRIERGGWQGDALTQDPQGGVELPPGLGRQLRIACRLPTTTPRNDRVNGGMLTIQWLGLMIEIAIGRVS